MSFEQVLEKLKEWQQPIITTVAVFIGLIVLRFLVVRLVLRNISDVKAQYFFRRFTNFVVVISGILVIGRVWFVQVESVATVIGLIVAGLAIAMKDLLIDVAGWLFILWRRPFSTGDRIIISDQIGDVADIGIFQFLILEVNKTGLEQNTGKMIHIPNRKIFSDTMANFSEAYGYVWSEVDVLVTFESNWEKAKQILMSIAKSEMSFLSPDIETQCRENAGKYMITLPNQLYDVWTKVKDSGVSLTVRYLVHHLEKVKSEAQIWESVLREFSKHEDIDFAYPTIRRYDNIIEGKQDAKANTPELFYYKRLKQPTETIEATESISKQ